MPFNPWRYDLVRSGEARMARWDEIDGETST